MHESDSPPAPPRFRWRARWQLVMAHNHRVGDVSTIQTTPPFEVYLAAHVQKVHKMIADHTTLTTLASHRFFLLMLYPYSWRVMCCPPSPPTMSFTGEAEIIFLIIHHLLILDALRHSHRWISAMLHGFRFRVVPRLLEACV